MLDKNEKQEPQKISGTVDGIVAYKAESGFCQESEAPKNYLTYQQNCAILTSNGKYL